MKILVMLVSCLVSISCVQSFEYDFSQKITNEELDEIRKHALGGCTYDVDLARRDGKQVNCYSAAAQALSIKGAVKSYAESLESKSVAAEKALDSCILRMENEQQRMRLEGIADDVTRECRVLIRIAFFKEDCTDRVVSDWIEEKGDDK